VVAGRAGAPERPRPVIHRSHRARGEGSSTDHARKIGEHLPNSDQQAFQMNKAALPGNSPPGSAGRPAVELAPPHHPHAPRAPLARCASPSTATLPLAGRPPLRDRGGIVGISGITDYGPIANTPLVADVTFNDGSQYLFQYEQSNDPSNPGSVTGRVSQVTLPTGGIIQYQYSGGTNGINCVDGSAATMTRTLTPGGPWTYVHSQVSGSEWKTTVTTPPDTQNQNSIGDDTVLYFQGIYETQRLAYQGSSSGTPLQTVVTCYNNNSTNCNTTAFTLPITRRTVTLQLPGGKQSRRDTFYDTTGYGLTTEIDEYDFHPTAPPLIRKTSTSYGSFSSGTCVALNNGIVDHPCVVKVTDSGGNTKAQTTYTYDQGTPASSGTTPQHTSITGSRGNLTTLTMSASSSSTTSLSKTFTYYDTGTPNVATDVNGAQTTYVYGTAAQGNSTVSCGNSFATTIKEPLSLSRSITWNCAGGVATLVTDENGNHVSSNYTDANFWRPANVYDQQNNETTISYLGQTAVETALVSFNGSRRKELQIGRCQELPLFCRNVYQTQPSVL